MGDLEPSFLTKGRVPALILSVKQHPSALAAGSRWLECSALVRRWLCSFPEISDRWKEGLRENGTSASQAQVRGQPAQKCPRVLWCLGSPARPGCLWELRKLPEAQGEE